MSEELERPPVAPLVAFAVAGVLGLVALKLVLGAILTGLRLALIVAVIGAIVYGVSRVRKLDD